jgi:hypothetical protein
VIGNVERSGRVALPSLTDEARQRPQGSPERVEKPRQQEISKGKQDRLQAMRDKTRQRMEADLLSKNEEISRQMESYLAKCRQRSHN